MAPLLKILVQWLPSLPSTVRSSSRAEPTIISHILDETIQQQQPIGLSRTHQDKIPIVGTSISEQLSSISWGKDRLDIFGLYGNNLTHKYWDGSNWYPTDFKLETLGNGLATPPVAVTWGVDRLDVFGLDDHNVIKHQYWDGKGWRPNVAEFENLGGQCDPNADIAVSTWGQDRLDVFCRGPDGDLLHQYYDGSQWQPSAGSLESLGGSLKSGPSVVSWGTNRLDVFAVNEHGSVMHLYWDGSQWSEWEVFISPVLNYNIPLTVTSWGKNRLDVYAVELEKSLWHIYWDGSKWADWEQLDGERNALSGSVAATSWSANRLDIVARRREDGHYLYKYYDGHAWQPDVLGWYDKTPGHEFLAEPSVVSWGENRLDIFGESDDGWLHQAWVGSLWYPGSTDWETLVSPHEDDSSSAGRMPAKTELQY